MPFEIVQNDITKMRVDAIVNAANTTLLGGGGVDGAIHMAAGPELLKECKTLGGCETGKAKITLGYRLPCRYIIHTPGPIWHGGLYGERDLLSSCYWESLQLATEYGCESVAFPLISSGIYGYPKDQAMKVAADTIRKYLDGHDMTVYLVIYNRNSFLLNQKLYTDIKGFIDDSYVSQDYEKIESERKSWRDRVNSILKSPLNSSPKAAPKPPSIPAPGSGRAGSISPHEDDNHRGSLAAKTDYQEKKHKTENQCFQSAELQENALWSDNFTFGDASPECNSYSGGLRDYLNLLDEGFRDMLLRKIDEKHMTDAECYRNANIDRKLFNKIKNQPEYRPGKTTVLALAISLQLPLEELKEMLEKAGFSLSHSSKADLIVEYFVKHGNYDIFEINEALFAFDQKLLGSVA